MTFRFTIDMNLTRWKVGDKLSHNLISQQNTYTRMTKEQKYAEL